jgi:CheY-like chemotaxis protein
MNESILIVEDDLDTLELLENYFTRHHYRVVTAAFGVDGVTRATERPPDLVILDIRLPDIDGYEVCRRLTTQQRTANIPIIFLTEKKERDSRIAGLQLGAVDYISKPFDIHELRLRVENALRRAGFRSLNHPVTALAGAQLLSEHLKSIEERDDWALIRVDLDRVADFEAVYGFVARDDMLRAVGMAVQAFTAAAGYGAGFAAHLDTASFFQVAGAEDAGQLALELCAKVQRIVTQFYPITHLEAGSAGNRALPRIEVYAGIVDARSLPVDRRREIVEQSYVARSLCATIPSEA